MSTLIIAAMGIQLAEMFGLVWDVLFLALGLGGLWLGTGVAVSATSTLVRRRGLSPVFLGLTVLAVGTDLSEFIVALDGAFL